jgi:hypothetical protein
MNERTKTGLEILQSAILLGVLGDVLFRATPWGLNVFLFIGAFVAAFAMLFFRRKRQFWNRQTIALQGALIFFAAMFVWRDSIQLKTLDTLAIFTILAILTLPALKIKTQTAGVFHYLTGFLWSGVNAAFAPFFLAFDDIKWKNISQSGWSKHLISILRGLAIAAPLLFIFGALFVAADAVFEGFVQRTLNIDAKVLVTHAFAIAAFSWFIAGYLRGAVIENFAKDAKESFFEPETEIKTQTLSVTEIKEEEPENTEEKPKVDGKKTWQWQEFDNSFLPRSFTLGAIETSIVLGLVNLLFLSFVIIQTQYLFGGMSLVQNTPDFKLAEYARRGFGELVTVSALVLPILLVSHWLLRKDNPLNEKIYRVLAGIQIILLFVIMLSATQRLLLLTGNLGYGLTTVRFYPMVFMILLALVFVWFALTVLRGARGQFAWGALWLSLAVLGILHVFNPDEYIVRTNVRLMQQGRMFDSNYVTELSDDATPALLESLTAMNFTEQCIIKNKLALRFDEAKQENDFRTWNLSRWRARRLMSANAEILSTSGCLTLQRRFNNDDF